MKSNILYDKILISIILCLTILALYFVTSKQSVISDIDKAKNERSPEIGGHVPAEDWFERQRAFPFEEIPHEEYLKSVNYVKNNMSAKGVDNSSTWALAGPTNIEGRITTIAIHPQNSQIVYTGTANGGVWKSTNFCQSWSGIFDNQNTSSIGAIAIDPMNPEIIYCGTGESNSLRSYYLGTGMYKSSNGGLNWMFIGLDSSYTIGNIAINPSNSQEVFVAAGGWTRRKNNQRGIYKSSNGGLNWERKLFIADSVSAIDVVIDPNSPSKIYAAMWERIRREDRIKYGGIGSGLFVSVNSGETWTQSGGGFPINDVTLGRISLDIARSNSQIVYALASLTSGNTRGLYKSDNGGVNWNLINPSVANSFNFAWFNRICRVDPVNPNRLFCGGIGMELSNNGGTSFSSVNQSHVDQHAAAFSLSNSNYIVIGNDGGIDYSTNGGATWRYSETLPITQFYSGEIDYNSPNTILAGTQDNGTIRTTGAAGGWDEINGGDGFYCLVDYTTSQKVYASSQNGGIVRSTDGGNSFFGATSGLDLAYTNWMTPYVMDKNNPNILYCGTYKIHRTTNGMQSWTVISPDLTNGHVVNRGTITTVDVSKSNPSVIYCGTDDANVWTTTNSGTNWAKINSGLPYRWVTRLAVHPDSANVCYVTLSGYKVDSTGSHIFRTTNYGANWTSIKGNLPDAPINDVVIDPDRTNTLYIGTDITVMFTTNLGSGWNILGSGIPSNVPCHDLTFHKPTRTLVVWTHGRSAFKTVLPMVGIENINTQAPVSFKLEQNYPNPFNPSTIIRYQIPSIVKSQTSNVRLIIYNALGMEIKTLVNDKQNVGSYEIVFDGSNVPSGLYFYKLTAGEYTDVKRMVLIK